MTRLTVRETICRSLCRSGRFETGEGTCALLCMNQLGSARWDCRHRVEVHGSLADKIILDLEMRDVVPE